MRVRCYYCDYGPCRQYCVSFSHLDNFIYEEEPEMATQDQTAQTTIPKGHKKSPPVKQPKPQRKRK